MNNKNLILIIFFSFLPLILKAQNGWQHWNEAEIRYPFSQSFSLGFTSEQRMIDNIKTFALHNYALALHYQYNNHFRIKVNYLYEREKAIDWGTENRIEIVPRISFNTKKEFMFSIFPRLEYRIFKKTDDWRWRQKVDIRKPITICRNRITPYLSYELFYVVHTHTLNMNWYTAGINKSIKDNFQIDLYYRIMSKKSTTDWQNYNVIGTTFSYLLKP